MSEPAGRSDEKFDGVGIVVVTHGRFGAELVAATEHAVGSMPAVRVLEVGPTDDIEERRRAIRQAGDAVNSGRGVIYIVDVFGSTPANLTRSVVQDTKPEGQAMMLANPNLAVMYKLAEARARDMPLADLLHTVRSAGRKNMLELGEALRGGRDATE